MTKDQKTPKPKRAPNNPAARVGRNRLKTVTVAAVIATIILIYRNMSG